MIFIYHGMCFISPVVAKYKLNINMYVEYSLIIKNKKINKNNWFRKEAMRFERLAGKDPFHKQSTAKISGLSG